MNPLMAMGFEGLDAPQGIPKDMNAPGSDRPYWPKSQSIQVPAGAKIWQGGGVATNQVAGMTAATGDYPGNGRDAGQGMSTQNPSDEWFRQMLQNHLTAGLGTLPRRDQLFPPSAPPMPQPEQTTGGAQSGSGGWG